MSLAIIIPAYKSTFLDKALCSIANQTCKDFTLYIGDDASPNDLYSIVKKYEGRINIKYHRFEDNLGGKDLVAQWERCIALSQMEEWLWLFSDDDEMEPNCVELFYKQLKQHAGNTFDVYHFNVKVIDTHSNIATIPNAYPQIIQSFDFYQRKMLGKIRSLVVENIFSRSIYNKMNGFQNFDLAWGSDTATWVKFGSCKGLFTIDGSYIKWRTSSENISPDCTPAVVLRKVKALNSFYAWTHSFFKNKKCALMYVNCKSYILRMRKFIQYLPKSDMQKSVDVFVENYNFKFALKYILMFFIRINNKIENA